MNEHDVIVLKEDFKQFKKGSIGTIIYIYGGKLTNEVYALVEFENDQTERIPLTNLELK